MSKINLPPANDVSITPVYLSARSAIVQPERAIAVTHYSLNKWLPRLGPGRWALVQYLRGLCIDAPRRADGTKRVTISWRLLAEYLQVHEETIASWLKHEVIPGDKPWRRIVASDDYSEYLGLFILRLRYAYETRNGKTRRVGFLVEILMEDPIAPEDEMRLKTQIEQMQLQQGKLGLETPSLSSAVNPPTSDLSSQNQLTRSTVNPNAPESHLRGQAGERRLTINPVNQGEPDSPPSVKQESVDLAYGVNGDSMSSQKGKSTSITNNVNELESYINKLKQYTLNQRNYRQLLEPIVSYTETLLDDYHSRAMLYKVVKSLFPNNMDIFLMAIEEALSSYALDGTLNKGAFFVSSLKSMAKEQGIDLGFKTSNGTAERLPPLFNQHPENTTNFHHEIPENEAIWAETLNVLQGQMTKALYNSVMQQTQLLKKEQGVYVIGVGSTMAREWLENRLKSVVIRALSSVVGTTTDIKFQLT